MFNEIKILLYLKAQSLEIYIKDYDQVPKIEFPAVVIRNMEIVDRSKLNELVIASVAKIGLEHQKAILLLSDHILFQKVIQRDTPDKEHEQIENFFDKIPLERSHLAKKVIPQSELIYAIGTNRHLYESIVNSFEENGWKIEFVVPSLVFGDLPASLNPEIVGNILKDTELLKKGDFLSENFDKLDSFSEEESGKAVTFSAGSSKFKRNIVVLFLIFILLMVLGGVVLAIKRPNLVKRLFFSQFLKASNTVSPSPASSGGIASMEASASAGIDAGVVDDKRNLEGTKSAVLGDKSSIKIQLLNGSGIAGQAGRVKEALENLGYLNFEVGNAEGQNEEVTRATYAKGIAQDLKDEITRALKELFTNVTISESTSSSFFNVKVVTGTDTK